MALAVRLSVKDMRPLITAGINNFGIVLGVEDTLADPIAAGLLVPILNDFEGPTCRLVLCTGLTDNELPTSKPLWRKQSFF